jgi:hypothetical protein
MNLQLTGTLLRELSLKQDKNGHDYYLGKLNYLDDSQNVFFFFNPNYDLTLRLTELQANQKLTLQGDWGKNQTFIATNFYLEEKPDLL